MKNPYTISKTSNCPIFGFEVIESDEWIFHDAKTNYTLTASLLDNSILHVKLVGEINFEIYKAQQLFVNNILNNLLEDGEKIILLHDYEFLFIKSIKARLDYAQWILRHKHQLSELVFYNVSKLNEIYIKAGMLFNPSLKKVVLQKSYKTSINYILSKSKPNFSIPNPIKEIAQLDLTEQIGTNTATYSSDKSWQYNSIETNFSCQHKIYNKHIIYRKLIGQITEAYSKECILRLDKVLSQFSLEDKNIFLLVDLSHSTKISYKSRRAFYYWLKTNSNRFAKIAYIGAERIFNEYLTTLVLLGKTFNIEFFDTKEDFFNNKLNHFHTVKLEKTHKEQKHKKFGFCSFRSKNRYIKELEQRLQDSKSIMLDDLNKLDELYEVFGRLSWDNSYRYKAFDIDENHKFAKLFDVATMLQYDIQEIINEKEELAQKAIESEQLKSVFLANMSHEIRTPMNAIMGFSSILLEEESINSEQKNYLKIIEKNSKQLLVLINDIIDFSKIEAGQINIDKENNNLNQFIRNVVESFYINPKITTNKNDQNKVYLSYNLALPNEDAMAVFDDVRLQQILSNLIQNAIKFTEKGYIKVKYTIENDFIIFSVKDTGIGISEDRKNKIFKRFHQADNSINRVYGGAGLGLSICKGLCKLMEGTIEVESEINKGSTFTFKIPYQKNINNTI